MEFNTTKFDIHVIGDSHSRLYSSPYLNGYITKVYYVGAITMHRIGRDKPTIENLQNISKDWYKEYLPKAKKQYQHMDYPKNDAMKPNDVVIFVFGEIDIRNNYNKQIVKGRSHDEILSTLADNYVNHVYQLQQQHVHLRFYIQSVMPPTSIENMKEDLKDYPIEGTFEQRLNATDYLNKLLKQKCDEYGLGYLDVTSYYQNDTGPFPVYGICNDCNYGELDKRVKDDNVHVRIDCPEGIEFVLKTNDIDYNIAIYNYKKKCKYPIPLNKYQREFAVRLRWLHIIWGTFMIISLFLPTFLAPYVISMWVFTLVINLSIGNGICFLTILEFRNSNCNDRTFYDELGMTRQYQLLFSIFLYTIAFIILPIRLYYFYKNVCKFKIGFKR